MQACGGSQAEAYALCWLLACGLPADLAAHADRAVRAITGAARADPAAEDSGLALALSRALRPLWATPLVEPLPPPKPPAAWWGGAGKRTKIDAVAGGGGGGGQRKAPLVVPAEELALVYGALVRFAAILNSEHFRPGNPGPPKIALSGRSWGLKSGLGAGLG